MVYPINFCDDGFVVTPPEEVIWTLAMDQYEAASFCKNGRLCIFLKPL